MKQAEELAKFFHETYERLAPSFNYMTRKASSVPWNEFPWKNRGLMIAVCEEVLKRDMLKDITSLLINDTHRHRALLLENRLTKIFDSLHHRYPECITIEGKMLSAERERMGYHQALVKILDGGKTEPLAALIAGTALIKYRPAR